MPIVRPRLTDYYGVLLSQAEADFAIPFLDEDIPLYLDPFLLWRSPSQQDNALHTAIINSFNHLGYLEKQGKHPQATEILTALSECDEVGFGHSHTRHGHRIGDETAAGILDLFRTIPEYERRGFVHFEEIQFFVEHISKDRISDIACNLLKSFLIDYTTQQCQLHGIPTSKVEAPVYSYRDNKLVPERGLVLPCNPETHKPLILVPKRWLRFRPWLDFNEYITEYFPREKPSPAAEPSRVAVLTFNRQNYGAVREYVAAKERTADDCKNDPLFSQIPIASAKESLKVIKGIPRGLKDENDRKYERELSRLLASTFYPQLDFAKAQSRTESGVLIRDLIFYNNRSHEFLRELFDTYDCRQIVMEMKNVIELQSEHINQLNRYMTDQFGKFGILLTRRMPLPKVFRNTIDLWAGQRRCILILDDYDMEQIVTLYESKQRDPLDVLKKKYVEFIRACPS
ncbi:MAG TPA: hypothetical protein VKG65_11620 [Terriglobales bacterium]|nr:hypothetical protein [Terriglobales bacterium]